MNIKIHNSGDAAITIEFGDSISPDINNSVIQFDADIAQANIPGILETIPTYRSILVLYDPCVTSAADLGERLNVLQTAESTRSHPARRWRIPVAYGPDFGADFNDLAARTGLNGPDMIALHADCEYRVYMIGFAPGFAYLGGLDPRLQVSRHPEARQRIPAGSVSIGGVQTALSSLEAPSAWQLIGRTPVRMFDRRRADPVLLRAGDLVRLEPIGPDDFERLDRECADGALVARLEEA